jgi:hypothetical protein
MLRLSPTGSTSRPVKDKDNEEGDAEEGSYHSDVALLLSLLEHKEEWSRSNATNSTYSTDTNTAASNTTTVPSSSSTSTSTSSSISTSEEKPTRTTQEQQSLTRTITPVAIVHQIVTLIAQHPTAFVHFLEQSNDRNQNWESLVQIIGYCHESNAIVHHFLCRTILVKRRGWTLLHWLCSHGGTPIHVLEALLQQFNHATSSSPSTATKTCTELIVQPDTYIGDTCLHLLCRNACQFSATKLQLILGTISITDAKQAVLIRNRLGGTVLHAATIGAAVWEAIHTIVSINPDVLNITSNEGVYPVSAIWYSYSETIPGYMSIVRIIEEHDHDTITTTRTSDAIVVNNHSHSICQSRPPTRHMTNPSFQRFWKKVEYLAVRLFVVSNTKTLQQQQHTDIDGSFTTMNEEQRKYILHGLLRCNVPINMILVCLRVCPESATAIDMDGNTPLHVLLQNNIFFRWKKQEYEAIELCVKAYPFAASIINHDKYIPLQLALLNKVPITSGIYDLLLQAAPNSIRYRFVSTLTENDATGLYPYQLAAILNSTVLQSVNTIYYLLLKQPSLLSE